MLPVTFGIPQGSVLGPTLSVLFTNDLLSSIDNGEIYMYADDTTVFAVGVSADKAIAKLNTALKELYKWCLCNKLTFHSKKSEFMLLGRGTHVGPVAPVFVGDSLLKQVISHPIALFRGELLPHRSFSHGQISTHRSFSHGQLSPRGLSNTPE